MTTDNNQNSGIEHTFPDGKQLAVREIANGQFGWWIDAPGSEARVSGFNPTSISFPDSLLQGEEPTSDAAFRAGKKAWKDKYGATRG